MTFSGFFQAAGQIYIPQPVQTTHCTPPVNGAQLPPELDPLGCSQPGGLPAPHIDLTRDCVTSTAGASLPRYFDPWGCTRPGGVTNPSDPSYTNCNTFENGKQVPIGLDILSKLISRCPNIRYINGVLVLYTGTTDNWYWYILTGEGRYVQYG